METMDKIYRELGISEAVLKYGQNTEQKLKERFAEIDATAEYNAEGHTCHAEMPGKCRMFQHEQRLWI